MEISTLKPNDRIIEIKHPATDEPVGIRFNIVSLNDDDMKQARRKIINKRLDFEKRGKNFKASDVEENELDLVIAAVKSWEWYDATFHNEVPAFNENNIRKVFEELPWIKDQVAEAVGDDKAFFQV